jgi:hypothetical protein
MPTGLSRYSQRKRTTCITSATESEELRARPPQSRRGSVHKRVVPMPELSRFRLESSFPISSCHPSASRRARRGLFAGMVRVPRSKLTTAAPDSAPRSLVPCLFPPGPLPWCSLAPLTQPTPPSLVPPVTGRSYSACDSIRSLTKRPAEIPPFCLPRASLRTPYG